MHKKKQGRPKKDDNGQNIGNSFMQNPYDFVKDFIGYLELIPGTLLMKEVIHEELMESLPKSIFAKEFSY